jgi:hypothetical protein
VTATPRTRKVLKGGAAIEDSTTTAAHTVAMSLYRAVGAPGTLMESPGGPEFALDPAYGAASLRSNHRVAVPLPQGLAWHTFQCAIVADDGRWIGIDAARSDDPARLKELAYDAVHITGAVPEATCVLILVKRSGAEEAEALAYAYDIVFGVAARGVDDEQSFAALRTSLRDRIIAAGF